MGRTNKIIGGRDTPGSEKDVGKGLLLYLGFKSTGRKGKRRPKLPAKKSGRPFKTVHPVIPTKMAANEVSRLVPYF